jgi:DNA-directed RNA polymerase subunit M/transcription elongation factor TFIIS
MTCPRCNGYAIASRDHHGAYVRCMICGHEQQDEKPDERPETGRDQREAWHARRKHDLNDHHD